MLEGGHWGCCPLLAEDGPVYGIPCSKFFATFQLIHVHFYKYNKLVECCAHEIISNKFSAPIYGFIADSSRVACDSGFRRTKCVLFLACRRIMLCLFCSDSSRVSASLRFLSRPAVHLRLEHQHTFYTTTPNSLSGQGCSAPVRRPSKRLHFQSEAGKAKTSEGCASNGMDKLPGLWSRYKKLELQRNRSTRYSTMS